MRSPFSAAHSHLNAREKFLWICVIASAVAVFTLVTARSAVGLRGSDQYWYVQDVETIAKGFSTTNAVYPATLKHPVPAPFVHNILPLYFVAVFVPWVGGYKAWLIANWLGVMAIAACIIVSVRRLTGNMGAAATAVSVFLCLPLTAWQASQPLAEVLIGVPLAIAVAISSFARSLLHWVLVTVFLGLAYLSRESYLATLVLLPLVFMAAEKSFSRRAMPGALVILIIALAYVPLTRTLFPQNIPGCPISVRLIAGSQLTDNMACYYEESTAKIPVVTVLDKAMTNVFHQFAGDGYRVFVLFYLPFNLLMLVSLHLFWQRTPEAGALLWLTAALYVTHFATIIIFQNEFRYQEPLLAIVAIGAATATHYWLTPSWRLWLCSAWAVIVAFGTVSYFAVTLGTADAGRQGRQFSAVKAYFSQVMASDGIIISRRQSDPILVAMAAHPRIVLHVDPDHLSSRVCAALEELNVRWVFGRPGDPILAVVKHGTASLPPTRASASVVNGRLWPVDPSTQACVPRLEARP